MRLNVFGRMMRFLIVALVTLSLPVICGCKDQRIDNAKPRDREVRVDAPGASVTVEKRGAAAPRAGNEVDVDVGARGVQVDVDTPAVRERVRETPRQPE